MRYKTFYKLSVGASALAMALTSQPQIAAAQSEDDDFLDVIYVTARKRPETQLETPISVTAFGQNDLDKRGIVSAGELSDFVPGFKFENVGTGGQSGRANPAIRFRGVGVQIGLAGASTVGALLWDGAYVSGGIGVVPLIDLAQTEVIKGPQTAFFGRNTFAGAVNFKPAEPTEEFEARVRVAGAFTSVQTGYSADAVISGPITDRLGARIAVSTEKTPGIYEFGDGTPLGEENTHAILGTLKFDATDSTVIKLSGYYVDSNDTSALSSFDAPVAPGDCNITYTGNLRDVVSGESRGSFSTDLSAGAGNTFCGSIPDWDSDTIEQANPLFQGTPPSDLAVRGFEQSQTIPTEFSGGFVDAPDAIGNTYATWRAHLTLDHEFDNGMSMNGFVSAGNNQNWGVFDARYGQPIVGFREVDYGGFLRESKDLSAEARVSSSPDGRLRWMAGVSYYQDSNLNFQYNNFTPPGVISDLDATVIGVFGSLDFDITDELTLSAEGRLQNDKLELNYNGTSGLTAAEAGFDPQDQEYTKFMPRVILSYQPEGLDLNLYGSFSQSYLQGTSTGVVAFTTAVPDSGLNPDNVGFFTPTQKLNAYEVGVKHQIGGQFQYSVALYRMDWQNQAFFVLSPTFDSISLPGDSKYTGVEVEFTYRPLDWMTFQGGYNYVDAEFTDYVATGSVGAGVLAPGLISSTTAIDASGNSIRYIPAHEASLSADFQLGDFVGVESFVRFDAIYTGAFFVDNFEYNKVDGNIRLNFRAGVEITEDLLFEAYGTNITNNRSFQTNGGTTFTSFFNQGDRRTFGVAPRGAEWGVRLTANF